jgi:glutamyl-tRNA(Gln) amidotransferase subunit D
VGGSPAYIIKENNIERNKLFNLPKREYIPKIKFDNRVLLLKYYPGLDPEIVNHAINSGYKGVIIEGTGLGHVGKIMFGAIEKARKNGLFIGMTSQCTDGMVRMTVYDSGRDLLNLGVVPLGNMIPETALVKTMWSLANSKDLNEMTNMMKENIALEFSD